MLFALGRTLGNGSLSLLRVPGVGPLYLLLGEVGYFMTIYHRTKWESLGMVLWKRCDDRFDLARAAKGLVTHRR